MSTSEVQSASKANFCAEAQTKSTFMTSVGMRMLMSGHMCLGLRMHIGGGVGASMDSSVSLVMNMACSVDSCMTSLGADVPDGAHSGVGNAADEICVQACANVSGSTCLSHGDRRSEHAFELFV
jgi:hypothetical protein